MWFPLHEVRSIARDVARHHHPAVEVIAVTPSEGGSGAAEVIVAPVDVDGRLASIVVLRAGTDAELRSSIARGLSRHFGGDRSGLQMN